MDFMTIKNDKSSEINVQKSRFISFIFPCMDVDTFQLKHKDLKKTYYDATHIIPVYRILTESKQIKEHFSDDGEPPKTAGWPILYILKQKSLIQIGVIVIRYFGGIKLGTSGLQKAYSDVVLTALNYSELVPYKRKINIKAIVPLLNEHLFYEFVKYECLKEDIEIQKTEYFEENNENYVSIIMELSEEKYSFILSKLKSKIIKIRFLE